MVLWVWGGGYVLRNEFKLRLLTNVKVYLKVYLKLKNRFIINT